VRFALVAVFFLGLLPAPAHAQDWPPWEQERIEQLESENRKLRRHLSGYGKWVRTLQSRTRKLRAANRIRLRLAGPYGEVAAFKCIHVFEGAWNDPNPPYFGGLQMDKGFMRSHGRTFYEAWGTADNWPPFIQMAVAIEAKLSGRGYYPWPNTARECGLL
jgi:hypothetical protein